MAKLYYVANARMPNEKAHGIQIAKMCEAFIEAGVDLTLVIPRRGTPTKTIQQFYGLRVAVPTIVLPALDAYTKGRILYRLSTFSFMCSYFFYFLFKKDRKNAVLYTVDLDHVSYGMLPFLKMPYFSEMHGGKPKTLLHRIFFSRASGIVATNSITQKQLIELFALDPGRTIVEPNGVDVSHFLPGDRDAARATLGIQKDLKLALYVGRFFEWKGLEILCAAAAQLKEARIGVVGGSKEAFETLTKHSAPENIIFFGDQPYTQIPLWLNAADSVLVLGTKRDEQSYQYTSPMKVFEYMASKKPIVASNTPALRDILTDEECFFYEPDSATDLARMIETSLTPEDTPSHRAEVAFRKVSTVSWGERAKRTRAFINEHLNPPFSI